MEYKRLKFPENGTEVAVSTFVMPSGHTECEAMVTVADTQADYATQLRGVEASVEALARQLGGYKVVSLRYFLSDPANQAPLIDRDRQASVSLIGQSPLDGSKVALWATLVDDAEVCRLSDRAVSVKTDGYDRIYYATHSHKGEGPRSATMRILDEYAEFMAEQGGTLLDNCLRTWFFVKDIDVNYPGVVTGRNEAFAEYGLSTDTHFLASTGIGGSNSNPHALVKFDAFASLGIDPARVTQLKALTHLNPTIEYGVAFERATAIDYDGWRHVIVSGTASIDNRGRVVHVGDVMAQAQRMIENIEALLAEGGCTLDDLSYGVVYLRDIADAQRVSRYMGERFAHLPLTVVQAPVCRPSWLIEMECSAKKRMA